MHLYLNVTSCILGIDFSNSSITVTVPAATTLGTQTYTIQRFFNVVDDKINELEQSFAIVAEIEDDVTYNCYVGGVGLSDCSCFQTQVGEIQCFGATEIRITDNDCKKYYVMNLEVMKTGLLWLCLVIDFLSQSW